MKKLILLSCLLITLSSLFSSCSIQRRTFNKGFHIEWRKGLAALPAKEKQEPIVCLTDSTYHSVISKLTSCDSIELNEHSISGNQLGQLHTDTAIVTNSTSINAISSSLEFKKALEKEKVSDDDPDEEYKYKPKGKVNKTAVSSFVFAMLAVLFLFIIAVTFPEVTIIAGIPALIAIITGIVALKEKRKNPDLRLSSFAYPGIIVGIVMLALSAGITGLFYLISTL